LLLDPSEAEECERNSRNDRYDQNPPISVTMRARRMGQRRALASSWSCSP